MSNFTIALAQLNSTPTLDRNVQRALQVVRYAASQGANMVVFPEHVLCRGAYSDIDKSGNTVDYFVDRLHDLSVENQICCVWGGIPIRRGNELFNTALVIDSDGTLVATYEKIHLFKLNHAKTRVDESAIFTAGTSPVSFTCGSWTFGLAICYDLRFPELFRKYMGSDCLLCPAEFTFRTGQFHWSPLLQARAIENQCYVAGINQCGQNSGMKVSAYGHSVVYDPWGNCRIHAGHQECTIVHQLVRRDIDKARKTIPAVDSAIL